MTNRNLARFDFAFGVVLILLGLAILFLIPNEELYQNGRRLKLGDIYRGLEALLGQNGARYFLALPFFAFGYLILRRLFKREELTRHSSGSR
ncbi:MAG: hypothetical protein PHI29_04680 [Gallionella sp.]|nr:hypothetical protein [Gallionella sp.]